MADDSTAMNEETKDDQDLHFDPDLDHDKEMELKHQIIED